MTILRNMKRTLHYFLAAVLFASVSDATAQVAFLYKSDVAVFYPKNYDAASMEPSMAITENMAPWSSLPESWSMRPAFSSSEGRNIVTVKVGDDVDLYGMGEVLGDLRRNGTETFLWNTDNYTYRKHSGKQLYQSHPWVLGVRKDGTSFGVLIDNTYKQHFSLSRDIVDTCFSSAPRVIIVETSSPQETVKRISSLTGTIEMPPIWALGYQQARFSYYPDSAVCKLADDFRKHKVPCDVIWMDIDYMDKRKVFTYDRQYFPHPSEVNAYLHDRGFKAVWMIDPGVKRDSSYSVYRSGCEIGAWVKDKDGNDAVGPVWPGDCVFPDYTKPSVRKWWAELTEDFMKDGADGIWNDMNEPAVFNGTSMTLSEDCKHEGGKSDSEGFSLPAGSHLRYHNVYGMLMVSATRQGVQKALPGRRPFVLSRSNFMGGHRYSATWTGDNASTWDYLRASIPMSLNLGLSCQPFNGPDVGGFSGASDAELLAHWTAVGAFFPFFRNHSADNTPHQEPWSFGGKAENSVRTSVNRRYMLLPYIYTLFEEAARTGMPVMRPLFFADARDSTLRDKQEQFLLGGDLLITPRWTQSAAIPEGGWQVLPLEKDDDGIQPVVAQRGGSIVPLTEVMQNTGKYAGGRITLYVCPDESGRAEGTLYDDSGDGYGYKKGDFSRVLFTARTDGKTVCVDITQTEGNRKFGREVRLAVVENGKVRLSEYSSGRHLTIQTSGTKRRQLSTKDFKLRKRKFWKGSLNGLMKEHKTEPGKIDLY